MTTTAGRARRVKSRRSPTPFIFISFIISRGGIGAQAAFAPRPAAGSGPHRASSAAAPAAPPGRERGRGTRLPPGQGPAERRSQLLGLLFSFFFFSLVSAD